MTRAQPPQTASMVGESPCPHSTQLRKAVIYQYRGLSWMIRCIQMPIWAGS